MEFPDTRPYIKKRVVATLIDYALIFGLTIAYIYLVGKPNEEGVFTVTGLPALVPLLFWFLYFVLAESSLGGTLGHQLFKLKVVSINNRQPTFSQTLLRRISDALEIAWCFGLIAYILTKNTPNSQRLGDIWAKTIVIGKNDSFPQAKFDFEQA
jgi:uncharacterized RDD family membrane protein YckC